jgi:hypothetical protein
LECCHNNVNVVVDELPSKLTIHTCLIIDIWTRQRRRTSTRFGAIRPKWWASSEIGAKSFRLYYGHPQLVRKCLMRAMQRTQFRAKIAKNDLRFYNGRQNSWPSKMGGFFGLTPKDQDG